MAVQKELACMHCKKSMPFGAGFKHDDDLNLVCSHCDKVVFGVTEAGEAEIKKVQSPTPTSTAMGFHSGWQKKEPLPIKLVNMPEADETPVVTSSESEPQIDDATAEEYSCFI